MPLLQLLGILAVLATFGITLTAALLWWRTGRVAWKRTALLAPACYLVLLVFVGSLSGRRTLPVGTPEEFCGFYLDCHLSVAVVDVEKGPSAWTVRLVVGNSARRVALAPVGLRVELLRSDSGALRLVPDGEGIEAPIAAGQARSFTVSFAAPRNGATPSLRVTEGYGVDRLIEGLLLGDDDALGRNRVALGL